MYKGSLILINRENPVRMKEAAMNLVKADGGHIHARPELDLQFEQACLEQLCLLLQAYRSRAAVAATGGYQSIEKQEQIYEGIVHNYGEEYAAHHAALPGYSEYQTGLAVDLQQMEGTNQESYLFTNRDKELEFIKVAACFGFIQRYPIGKESLTDRVGNPSHFRYVGQPHASVMVRYSLCLEEYLAFLQTYTFRNPLYVKEGSVFAAVYYVKASREMPVTSVPIALGASYEMSGNNRDGYIITVFNP